MEPAGAAGVDLGRPRFEREARLDERRSLTIRESAALRRRAALLVCVVALATYANSLSNGFALDDEWFLVENEVVTEARYREAFTEASWPGALEGAGNYRPVQLASFAAEWSIWGGWAMGFHAVSVAAHAIVSLLVFLLLASFVTTWPALVGALFFAVHPVHVEAVANVMGRSELYAAMAYLTACLLYLRVVPGSPESAGGGARGARLLGLVVLFLIACGSKEIAVTLPAMVIALEVCRRSHRAPASRVRDEGLTCLALFLTLGIFVIVRWNALGAIGGQSAAAGLGALDHGERLLNALAVWPHYLRLMVFPLDLSADYSPAVIVIEHGVSSTVLLGAGLLVGTIAAALVFRRDYPALALGFAWFFIAISPVSNLFIRSDVLLAERTLYLPSVGAAFVVAAVTGRLLEEERQAMRVPMVAAAVVAALLLTVRTVSRNPTWADTFTVLVTLNEDHPESWWSQRTQAISRQGLGDFEGAAAAYERALQIAPDHYQLLVDAAAFYDETGDWARADSLLRAAVTRLPEHPEAYRRLAEQRLRRGDGRGAHAAALEGIAHAGSDSALWGTLSESYVQKGDLAAAIRARRASIGEHPTRSGWSRLAELFEALGQLQDAEAARTEAGLLGAGAGESSPGAVPPRTEASA